jgi:hypothetical protein
VVAGALAFVAGLTLLFALPAINEHSSARRLFQINAILGASLFYMGLGGFLVVQAASALGSTGSTPMPLRRWPWLLLPLFPPFVIAGQVLAEHPARAPWLFPLVNIAAVAIPSLFVAAIVARRYQRAHPFAWPVSWREWTSGFVYGAIGATSIAVIVNTGYIAAMGALLVHTVGHGPAFPLDRSLPRLPHGWGIFLDLSSLSVVAPLNEEACKGFLVALFFFRRGGAARCFMWGVLAGTGFNLLETFQNSLSAVSPEALADQTIGTAWWWFASARAGTAAMHGLASGLAGLGFYGLLRRRPRFLVGYPAGVLLHGTWNLLVYAVWGDALFSQAGPDSTALDVAGIAGMLVVFAASLVMLWVLSGQLRDEAPAPIYRMIGMLPQRGTGRAPPPPGA